MNCVADPRWVRGAPVAVMRACVRDFGRRIALHGLKIRGCAVLVLALEDTKKLDMVGFCSRGEEVPSLLRGVWDSETSSGNGGKNAGSMDIGPVVGVKSRLILTSGVESKCLLMNLNKCLSRRWECGVAHSGWETPETEWSW
jgi:hypothetical protein